MKRLWANNGLWAVVFSALLLSACSQLLQRQTCVVLASDVHYCLAPLPAMWSDTPQSLTQKVSISVGDERHELLTQLELEGERMTLVGLAPLGQALFTLVYDGHTLSSEQSLLLGQQFKAEYLVAIMQLIYWPEASITPTLSGGILSVNQCADKPCRQIFAQTANPTASKTAMPAIVQIDYDRSVAHALWQAHIKLSMPQAKFALTIEPI